MTPHVSEGSERPPGSTSAFRATRSTHPWAWGRCSPRSLPCPQPLTNDRRVSPLPPEQTPSLRRPQASPPAPFPSRGGGGLNVCVPNPPGFGAPPVFSGRLGDARAHHRHRAPGFVLCALRRSRRNGLSTAVPHHPPLRAVQPTARAAVRKRAPSPPHPYPSADAPPRPRRSLWSVGEENRCLSAPPSPRAPEPAPLPPPPPTSWRLPRAWTFSLRCSCCRGRRLAST